VTMRLSDLQTLVEDNGIIFLAYGSALTQDIIVSIASSLEKNPIFANLNMGLSSDVFTVFVEVSQNMMMYNKEQSRLSAGEGIIVVGRDTKKNYFVLSRNLVSRQDKEKLTEKLEHIQGMDRQEIKETYRALRRSGRHSHAHGAGIGFYEIAKRSERFEFEFTPIDDQDEQYYYVLKSYLHTREVQS